MINEKRLRGLLSVSGAPSLYCMDITSSTSTDARDIIKNGEQKPFIVTANTQSGGRGRRGRDFISPQGGIYLTAAFPTSLTAPETVGVTSCAAVAVCRALHQTAGIECGIKWVNDIYYGGGKLCGILTEFVAPPTSRFGTISSPDSPAATGWVLIGVGINAGMPPAVCADYKITSLGKYGICVDEDEIAACVYRELAGIVALGCDFRKYAPEYRARSLVIGKTIVFTKNGISYTGVASSITDTGALCVMCGSENITLNSGEVSVRLT